MRTITIVQGLTILTASVYTLKFDDPIYFRGVAFFGLAFTVVLALQQRNYLHDFECHLEKIAILEERVWEEGEKFWGEGKKGPWATYKDRHEKLRKGIEWPKIFRVFVKFIPAQPDWFRVFFRLFVEYGPSVLFAVAFILLVILKHFDVLPNISQKICITWC